MKNLQPYAKPLAALLKKVRHSHAEEPPPQRDPVTQLVIAFLEWNAGRAAARAAHQRITALLVDNNDLRVSHTRELVELLGPRYPRAEERAARLHEALQEVFVREHAVALDELNGKSKRQVMTYLSTLPGMTPFVAAQVASLAFACPTVAVDDNTLELLKRAGAMPPEAGVDEASAFVDEQVKESEALATLLALHAWADANVSKLATVPPARKAAAQKPARPKAAKKPAKTKASKPAKKSGKKKK